MKYDIKISPPQMVILGFAGMIFLGTILLNMPISSKSGESIGFLNALFTSTSAVCVTGLTVVNTMDHWTLFGKIVILSLIQLGGLGFMTIVTIFLLLLNEKITLRERLAIQSSFNQRDISGMVKLVIRVVKTTFIIEFLGCILLALTFYFTENMTLLKSLTQGFFHSISAFCNAGFDNIGYESLTPYKSNLLINLIIMSLIISGGLGFTVWYEIYQKLYSKLSKSKKIVYFSLHSKIVFAVTSVLILCGTLFFLLFEWNNEGTIASFTVGEKILASLFQSITLRTAGFNTIDQKNLTEISKMFSSILMIIGGSPASTAGGIKTVTIGVVFISMFSALKGKSFLEAFERSLSLDVLQKALTVICAMLCIVFLSTILLFFTEQNMSSFYLLDFLFETSSAAGTVGLTTGVTPNLSSMGKIIIIICMFFGRLSPLTIALALTLKNRSKNTGIRYIKEDVIIG